MKDCKVAFVGFVVPDIDRYLGAQGSGAGNLAQNGFVEALAESGHLDKVWSFEPVQVWPQGRFAVSCGRTCKLECGVSVRLMPLVNLPFIRDVLRVLALSVAVIFWSVRNCASKKVLVVYNIFSPNVLFLRVLTWLTHVKLIAIIYELGTISGYRFNWWHRLISKGIVERVGIKCIPRLDGRILITDAIARDFAPNKHFVRVDGGISSLVTKRLFALRPRDGGEFRLMFAGGVNHWNHIEALMDYMRRHADSDLRLWIAGAGNQVGAVLEASKSDCRIVYRGHLTAEDLFQLYEQADVLLNLRDTEDPALAYHFPSKLLEILAIGKPVITSSTNHAKESYGQLCRVIDSLSDLDDAISYFKRMSSDERCAYGQRARAWMLKNKTWKSQGTAINSYIAKVLEQ